MSEHSHQLHQYSNSGHEVLSLRGLFRSRVSCGNKRSYVDLSAGGGVLHRLPHAGAAARIQAEAAQVQVARMGHEAAGEVGVRAADADGCGGEGQGTLEKQNFE